MKGFHPPRGSLPVLTLALCAIVFAWPRPVLVNLGAGDEALARGFQEWERAGPDGRTMFRWTRDGATIELPANVRAERLTIRLRLARFLPTPVDLTWRVNGRDAARHTVRPRGWHVETLELGAAEGPLILEIRSFDQSEALGAAIDWVEIGGAQRMTPTGRAWLRLLLLVVVVPMMAGYIAGTRPGNVLGITLLVLVPVLLWIDPAQGLVAVTKAALPAALALCVLAIISRLPGETHEAFVAASVVSTVVLLLLLHPAFYYPDVDTHARLLGAIRHDPSLLLDPSPYQARTGAWMRTIAGAKVAFPYSPVFHAVAWPLALVFGETDAIKTLAAIALGTSALFVHGLARHAGLGAGGALLSQVLFVLLPIESSRLFLALFPAIFAQALELALWTFLAAYLGAPTGRATLMLAALLMATQIAYTGSLANVAAVVAVMTVVLWTRGERTTALRLLAAGVASSVAVALVLYARFLPVLWTQVLPYASGADAGGLWARTIGRGLHFLGPYPLLALLGAAWLRRSMTWDVLASVAAAGAFLLLLRGPLPSLIRDVKEIELLAAPVSIFAAFAIARISKGNRGRYAALAIVVGLLAWSILRAVTAYRSNVFAAD